MGDFNVIIRSSFVNNLWHPYTNGIVIVTKQTKEIWRVTCGQLRLKPNNTDENSDTSIYAATIHTRQTLSLTLNQENMLKTLNARNWGEYSNLKEVTWDWRKLHNEELAELYFSPNIISVIKSRRMTFFSHVTHMRETNKKLWEELIAYFPLIHTDRTENDINKYLFPRERLY
jgi:hypothetical protein